MCPQLKEEKIKTTCKWNIKKISLTRVGRTLSIPVAIATVFEDGLICRTDLGFAVNRACPFMATHSISCYGHLL